MTALSSVGRAMALAAGLFGLGACVNNPSFIAPPGYARAADFDGVLIGANGASVGSAAFWETPRGVYIHINEAGILPVGWHGLHLHEKGDCSAADFTSAGAHVGHAASGGPQHGLMNPAGPEPGDLPNFFKPPVDLGAAELFSPFVTLGAEAKDGRMPLRDADGAALVMHANPDDHATQPIGGAGARIACLAIPPAH